MRVEIVDREEPMATEEDVYQGLPEHTYATIGDTSRAERNGDAENLYNGEVEVTPYYNPDHPSAENMYHGNVDVKTYNEDVPPPFETRL